MIANALSATRLALVLPFVVVVERGTAYAAGIAALLFVIAVVTDLLDGPAARRFGTESAIGRALDHGSDFLFVTGGLFACAWRGELPWLLPLLVTLAFVQYVADSLQGGRRELRMSALGRWNGIFYFVPLAGVILADLAGDRANTAWLRPASVWIARALILTTLASILDRLLAFRRERLRAARGSRDAGR